MLGIIKKSLFFNYEHWTKRNDWEYVLDELFLHVIHASKMGVAVISNTARENERDNTGDISSQLTFRVDNDQSAALKEAVRLLDTQQFEQMFVLRDKMKPAIFDCYRVKTPAFLRSTLVYFIEQDSKKAILFFALPLVHHQLSKYVKTISNILTSPEKRVKKAKEAAPRSFAIHQFATTKFQLLKERLNYLDSLEHLNTKEIKEMQALEEFVMKQMGQIF